MVVISKDDMVVNDKVGWTVSVVVSFVRLSNPTKLVGLHVM